MEKTLIIVLTDKDIKVNGDHNMTPIELLGIANFLEYWTRLQHVNIPKIIIEDYEDEEVTLRDGTKVLKHKGYDLIDTTTQKENTDATS
jgi:hypothetical protein